MSSPDDTSADVAKAAESAQPDLSSRRGDEHPTGLDQTLADQPGHDSFLDKTLMNVSEVEENDESRVTSDHGRGRSSELDQTLADQPGHDSFLDKTLMSVSEVEENDESRVTSDHGRGRSSELDQTLADQPGHDSSLDKTLINVAEGDESSPSNSARHQPLGMERTLQDVFGDSLAVDRNIGQTISVPESGEDGSGESGDDLQSQTRVTHEPDESSLSHIHTPGNSSLIVRSRSVGGFHESQSDGNDYKLLEKLGRGGVGVVYSAKQASIDRTVALKKLHPHMAADAQHRNKFLAEAVIIGDLDHPQIVPIYDLAKNDKNELFYTMKRVEGTPWSDKIDELSLDENLSILMKVCEAIAFAHYRGVIHRDLKPDNVMLGDFGEVLVMDWGLALLTEESSKRECVVETGSLGGTPSYMAPEMVIGPIDKITYASDIYLLGGQLYRILTGKAPHSGENVMMCVKNAAKNVIQKSDVTGELMDIALKAMATKPKNRYPSALEFRDALRNYESHEESLKLKSKAENDLERAKADGDYELFARSVFGFEEALALWTSNSAAQEGQLRAREKYAECALSNGDFDLGLSLLDRDVPSHLPLVRRLEAGLHDRNTRQRQLQRTKQVFRWATFSFMLILTLACVVIYDRMKAEQSARTVAEAATIKAVAATDRAEESADKERKAKQELSHKNEELAVQTEEAKQARRKAESSERVAKRNRRLAEDSRRVAEESRKLAEAQTYLAQIALAAKKIEENRFDEAREILSVYRGSHLVGWEWGYLWDFCNLAEADQKVGTILQDVTASPDGTLFAVAADDGLVRIWKTADFRDPQQLQKVPLWADAPHPENAAAITSVEFAPDRSLLAVGDSLGNVSLLQISDNLEITRLPDLEEPWESPASVSSIRFSFIEAQDSPGQSSRWMLVGSESGEAAIWDLNLGAWLEFPRGPTLWGHRGEVRDIAVSPDRRFILTAGEDDKIQIWSTSPLDATQAVSRVDAAEKTEVVEPYDKRKTVYWMHEGAVLCLDITVDDRGKLLVASGGRDGSIQIWNIDDVPSNNLTSNPKRTTVRESVNNAAVQDLHFFRRPSQDPGGSELCLLTCGDDRTVELWKINTQELFIYRADSNSRQKQRELTAATLEHQFRGHGSRVTACTPIPVEQGWDQEVQTEPLIVSVGEDQRVMLWNPAEYREHEIFESEAGAQILDATFDSESDRIASVTSKGVLSIIDLKSNRSTRVEERELPSETRKEGHDYLANQGKFVPAIEGKHERYYLTAGIDGKVIVWDIERGVSVKEYNQSGRTSIIALSPDSKKLITGGEDNSAWVGVLPNSIFNPDAPEADETPMIKLSGHEHAVTAACFSADGNWILTGDTHGELRVWRNPNDFTVEREVEAVSVFQAHREEITEILASRGFIVTTSKDYAIKFWSLSVDADSGKVVLAEEQQRRLRGSGEVTEASISPSGKYFACVRQQFDEQNASASERPQSEETLKLNSEIKVYDLSTDPPREWKLEKKDNLILATDFFLNRNWLLLTDNKGKVLLWDWESGQEYPLDFDSAIENYCTRVDTSGTRLVTTGGRQIRIWDFDPERKAVKSTRTELGSSPVLGPHYGISHVSFSSDGLWIVTGDRNGYVKLWERNPGEETYVLQYRLPVPTNRYVVAAQFSPKSPRTLLTVWEDMLILWEYDGKTWVEQKQQVLDEKPGISYANYSPSGLKLFLGRQDGGCEVWNATELSRETVMQGELRHHLPINCGVFSADERLIVTGCDDKEARGILWSLEEGKWMPVTEITGHSGGITSVAFSPIHQLRLLTGSRDGTAKLWDISQWTAKRSEHSVQNGTEQKSIKELLTLRGHEKEITAVHFDRTGQFILTASRDGKTIRWSSAPINPAVVARRDYVDLFPGQPVHFCQGFEILDPVSPALAGGILSLSIRPVSGAKEFWGELPPVSVSLESDNYRFENSADFKLIELVLRPAGSETSRKIGTVLRGSTPEAELSLPLEIQVEPGTSHFELMDFLDQLVCTPQVSDEQTGQFEVVVRLRLELPEPNQGPTPEAFITLRINIPDGEETETE